VFAWVVSKSGDCAELKPPRTRFDSEAARFLRDVA